MKNKRIIEVEMAPKANRNKMVKNQKIKGWLKK